MNRDLAVALTLAVTVHLLVVGMTLVSWQADAEVTQPDVPPHVKAVVMEPEASGQPSRSEPEPEPEPEPQPEPEPEAASEPEAETEKVSTEPSSEPDPDSGAPEPASLEQPELEEMLAREELEMERAGKAQEAEIEQERSKTSEGQSSDAELARQISAIRSAVGRHWNRPPGARNNMETVLRIRLLPGGEVVEATVVESSGNVPLDRSTVAAVQNASPLPVPSGEDFNRFRKFRMSFKPEDLSL